ncbi:MAG TPA: acyl carrier protein [Herpetosiphonaceae bacterium]
MTTLVPAVPTDETILGQLRTLVETVVADEDRDMVDTAAITPETHLLSLPLDSMATMELMTGIEDTFQVYIPEEQGFAFTTVGDVITYVREKLIAKAKRTAEKQAAQAEKE